MSATISGLNSLFPNLVQAALQAGGVAEEGLTAIIQAHEKAFDPQARQKLESLVSGTVDANPDLKRALLGYLPWTYFSGSRPFAEKEVFLPPILSKQGVEAQLGSSPLLAHPAFPRSESGYALHGLSLTLQLQQKLQHQLILTMVDMYTGWSSIYDSAEKRTYEKHGLSFEYAVVRRADFPYMLHINCAGFCSDGMLFVMEDYFLDLPEEIRAKIVEIIAVHEYGESIFLDHDKASLLEFAIAQKEGFLEEYLRILNEKYLVKFRDISLFRMREELVAALEEGGIKVENKKEIRSRKAPKKSEEDKAGEKIALDLAEGFRWPDDLYQRYHDLFVNGHEQLEKEAVEKWAQAITVNEQTKAHIHKAQNAAVKEIGKAAQAKKDLSFALVHAKRRFLKELVPLHEEITEGVLEGKYLEADLVTEALQNAYHEIKRGLFETFGEAFDDPFFFFSLDVLFRLLELEREFLKGAPTLKIEAAMKRDLSRRVSRLIKSGKCPNELVAIEFATAFKMLKQRLDQELTQNFPLPWDMSDKESKNRHFSIRYLEVAHIKNVLSWTLTHLDEEAKKELESLRDAEFQELIQELLKDYGISFSTSSGWFAASAGAEDPKMALEKMLIQECMFIQYGSLGEFFLDCLLKMWGMHKAFQNACREDFPKNLGARILSKISNIDPEYIITERLGYSIYTRAKEVCEKSVGGGSINISDLPSAIFHGSWDATILTDHLIMESANDLLKIAGTRDIDSLSKDPFLPVYLNTLDAIRRRQLLHGRFASLLPLELLTVIGSSFFLRLAQGAKVPLGIIVHNYQQLMMASGPLASVHPVDVIEGAALDVFKDCGDPRLQAAYAVVVSRKRYHEHSTVPQDIFEDAFRAFKNHELEKDDYRLMALFVYFKENGIYYERKWRKEKDKEALEARFQLAFELKYLVCFSSLRSGQLKKVLDEMIKSLLEDVATWLKVCGTNKEKLNNMAYVMYQLGYLVYDINFENYRRLQILCICWGNAWGLNLTWYQAALFVDDRFPLFERGSRWTYSDDFYRFVQSEKQRIRSKGPTSSLDDLIWALS